MLYLVDPTNGQKSVSLTIMMVSFVTLLGFAIASVLEYVKNVDPLLDIFYACAALYFGRRVSINGKLFSGKEGSKSE